MLKQCSNPPLLFYDWFADFRPLRIKLGYFKSKPSFWTRFGGFLLFLIDYKGDCCLKSYFIVFNTHLSLVFVLPLWWWVLGLS